VKSTDSSARHAAVKKLSNTEQDTLAKIADDYPQTDSTILRVVIPAFAQTPEEHRHRLLESVLPAIDFLCEPDVMEQVGEIVAMKTTWSQTSASYDIGTATGERFSCSIVLKNLPEAAERTWSSRFPRSITLVGTTHFFSPAHIQIGGLLAPVFEQLPQARLARFAVEDSRSWVHETAFEKLTDQALLAKVALDGLNLSLRVNAVKKLTDQTLLAKVAVEASHWLIRSHAVEKLTDETLLAKIAVEDTDDRVRNTAKARLEE
jgi:hypothetical protein